MIGNRLLAAGSVVLLVAALGSGAPRPEVARTAREAVTSGVDSTLAAIATLNADLGPAVDAAREGSARVVAGDEDPAERMAAGADALLAADSAATDVREAVGQLDRARMALDPEAQRLPPGVDPGELASIAGQLRDAGEAGARFADNRRRADGVSQGLVDALDAVAADEPDVAREHLRLARDAVDGLREYEGAAPTLTVWIDTVDAMIRAMQRLMDAVRTNDAEQARAARAEFAEAATGAAEADRALRIGTNEAGSGLTAVAVERLGAALAALDDLEQEVRGIRGEAGA